MPNRSRCDVVIGLDLVFGGCVLAGLEFGLDPGLGFGFECGLGFGLGLQLGFGVWFLAWTWVLAVLICFVWFSFLTV